MTGDVELRAGVPRWHNFLLGLSPLAYFFTGAEVSGELGWDVLLVVDPRTPFFVGEKS